MVSEGGDGEGGDGYGIVRGGDFIDGKNEGVMVW